MKKIKLFKSIIMLFAVFTLSNCEENGEIQFIVVDDFESTAKVTGLNTTTSFTTSSSTNISDLLDGASTFVEANIEKVTFTLQDDYSGDSVSGTFQITVGSIDITQTLTLVNTGGVSFPLSVSLFSWSFTSAIVI